MTRVDKYLWTIRVFKTRSEATDACKSNRIRVNGNDAKPSKEVNVGDTVEIRKGSIRFSFKIIAIPVNRLPAKLVPDHALNVTPQEELDKLHTPKETLTFYREHGTGRPTKKERRDIDSLMDDIFGFESEDDG